MAPSSTRRCPFCHKQVAAGRFDAHVARHTERLEDGQMTDHITLPPEERQSGSLDEVPRVYEHRRCGATTGMPEEIIRSYLKNPWLYNDYTFCCGCGDYFHEKEFTWTETGENLHHYKRRLQARARKRGLRPPLSRSPWLTVAVAACFLLGLLLWFLAR